MSPPSDDRSQADFEAASRGDGAAVSALLERHLADLYTFVRLNTGPMLAAKESHADLVQSTCREILGDLAGVRYEGEAQFRRWLFASALNKIRNRARHWQAQRRDVHREAAHVAGEHGTAADILDLYGRQGTPSEDVIAREAVQRMEQAFASMPESYREIVTLVRIVGLGYPEVAAHLGITEDNARKLYSRASARIVRLLTPS